MAKGFKGKINRSKTLEMNTYIKIKISVIIVIFFSQENVTQFARSLALPRIMPLGFSGVCQTTLTEVIWTSGKISLMGGPGTDNGKEQVIIHLLAG